MWLTEQEEGGRCAAVAAGAAVVAGGAVVAAGAAVVAGCEPEPCGGCEPELHSLVDATRWSIKPSPFSDFVSTLQVRCCQGKVGRSPARRRTRQAPGPPLPLAVESQPRPVQQLAVVFPGGTWRLAVSVLRPGHLMTGRASALRGSQPTAAHSSTAMWAWRPGRQTTEAALPAAGPSDHGHCSGGCGSRVCAQSDKPEGMADRAYGASYGATITGPRFFQAPSSPRGEARRADPPEGAR